MLLAHQSEEKNVIVNKPALRPWLHAWTTGESFSSRPPLRSGFQKKEASTLAAVRRMRLQLVQAVTQ